MLECLLVPRTRPWPACIASWTCLACILRVNFADPHWVGEIEVEGKDLSRGIASPKPAMRWPVLVLFTCPLLAWRELPDFRTASITLDHAFIFRSWSRSSTPRRMEKQSLSARSRLSGLLLIPKHYLVPPDAAWQVERTKVKSQKGLG